MKLKTRLLSSFFIFSVFTINACSIPAINSDINKLKINKSSYHVNTEKSYTIDMGKKNGSTFNFKIKLNNSDFKIKANENGEVYTADDIDEIKVILFNQSSFTDGSTISTPTTFGPFTISTSSNSSIGTNNISVNFTNVPGNVNPYRVGIQALKDSKIITKATDSYGLLNSEIYAVSDTGGDDNSGKLTIDATTLKFTGSGSPTTPLGSTLNLINADGANVESQITITENTEHLSSIQLVRFYLVKDNSGVITVMPGLFDFIVGTKFESLQAGTPSTIKFLNIPAGNYRVAAAAYNNTTASSGANITSGTDNLGLTFGNFTLSNMITVNPDLTVSTAGPLVLSVNLN